MQRRGQRVQSSATTTVGTKAQTTEHRTHLSQNSLCDVVLVAIDGALHDMPVEFLEPVIIVQAHAVVNALLILSGRVPFGRRRRIAAAVFVTGRVAGVAKPESRVPTPFANAPLSFRLQFRSARWGWESIHPVAT